MCGVPLRCCCSRCCCCCCCNCFFGENRIKFGGAHRIHRAFLPALHQSELFSVRFCVCVNESMCVSVCVVVKISILFTRFVAYDAFNRFRHIIHTPTELNRHIQTSKQISSFTSSKEKGEAGERENERKGARKIRRYKSDTLECSMVYVIWFWNFVNEIFIRKLEQSMCLWVATRPTTTRAKYKLINR